MGLRKTRFTKEEVKEDILNVHKKLDKTPTIAELQEYGRTGYTYQSYYPTYTAALTDVGLPPNKKAPIHKSEKAV